MRESLPGVKWLGALRLVLGGHSRAPQPYGPRLCAKHQSLRPGSRCHHAHGTISRPSPYLTLLRLVLGGHSRAPQPYGPRLCAKRQSLRPGIATALRDHLPGLPPSHPAAAGPRRTQPRSTALRTATVCEAPVAAPGHCHRAPGPSPGLPPSHPAAAGPRRTQPRSTMPSFLPPPHPLTMRACGLNVPSHV
jgi:hypothetical protein